MSGGARSGCRPSARVRQSSRRLRTAARTGASFSIALTAPPSRQLAWGISAWPVRPGTVTLTLMVPRQAAHTSNPVGSPQMPASALTPRSATRKLPAPDDSSSELATTSTSPCSDTPSARRHSMTWTKAASAPFMSLAPRPYR